jgi:hypothetical protein
MHRLSGLDLAACNPVNRIGPFVRRPTTEVRSPPTAAAWFHRKESESGHSPMPAFWMIVLNG